MDPIKKPPMTERGDHANYVLGLNKSSSNGNLINGNGKKFQIAAAALSQNSGLIMKMMKNFDLDQTGMVST